MFSVVFAVGSAFVGVADAGKIGNRGHQLAGFDRLAEMDLEPDAQGPEAILFARVGCQGDRRGLAALLDGELPQLLKQRIPILPGHRQIADQHVGDVPCKAFKRLAHGPGGDHFGLGAAQDFTDHLAGVDLIVDQEYALSGELDGQFRALGGVSGIGPFFFSGRKVFHRFWNRGWHGDDECRSLIQSRALGGDGTAVHFDDVAARCSGRFPGRRASG